MPHITTNVTSRSVTNSFELYTVQRVASKPYAYARYEYVEMKMNLGSLQPFYRGIASSVCVRIRDCENCIYSYTGRGHNNRNLTDLALRHNVKMQCIVKRLRKRSNTMPYNKRKRS